MKIFEIMPQQAFFCELSSDLNHDENSKSLNKQMELLEIVSVCKHLTDGNADGVDQTVYQHVTYGGPDLCKILHVLCKKMFGSVSVPSGSLMGMILPLFKGKGLKACVKDNYRGTTLFPVIIKVFEVIILRRLENFPKKAIFPTFSLAFLRVLAVQRLPLLLWRPLTICRKGKFLPVSWTYAKHLTQCGLMDCFINCSQSSSCGI